MTTLASAEGPRVPVPLVYEEEFAYAPTSSSRSRLPKLERTPKAEREPKGLRALSVPASRGSRSKRAGRPIVVILLVVAVAAAALMLKPKSSPETPAAAAPPAAQSLANAQPVVFRYAYQAGDTRTYNMTMKMHLAPGDAGGAFDGTIRSTMAINVVRQLPNGAAVLDVSITNLRLEPPPDTGGPGPMNDAHMRVTLAPDGRILYFEGSGGLFGNAGAIPSELISGNAQPSDETQSQFLFPRFSGDAVKPGDTWDESSSFSLPFGNEGTVVKSTGKLVGYQNSTYGEVANIKYTVAAPLDFAIKMADLASMAMQQMARGSDPIPVPPELQNALLKLSGNMSMNAKALVQRTSGELVKLDGTMTSNTNFSIEGLASGAPAGFPSATDLKQTIKLQIVRIDRETS